MNDLTFSTADRLRYAISCFNDSNHPLTQDEIERRALTEPEWFLREVMGISPWQKQMDIVTGVRDHEDTLCYSCVASGKSFIAGGLVPWWLYSHWPARVFTIAPTERQLKINLWGELSKIYFAAPVPLGGELLTLNWKLSDNWFARGFSPRDAMAVFGIHGPNDLFIIDDAQGITQELFDAIENAAASGTAHYLYLCNPTMVAGPLYEAITSKRSDMHTIQITAFDTPNVMAGHVVVPGLIIKEKVQEWAEKYGVDSDFYRVKVLAVPPHQEPDTLIPIDWLEMARMREVPQDQGGVILGVDIARFGDDSTVICAKEGRQILPLIVLNGNNLMEVTGRIIQAYRDTKATLVNADEIGIGAGVVDRLHELKIKVHGVNVSVKPHDEERFKNLRAEMWWAARCSLDPKNKAAMAIPNDNELIADLSAMKYKVDSAGRIQIESKEEMKERLGRSPDKGDAYALAVFESYMDNVKPAVAFSQAQGLPRLPSWL